MPTPLEVAAAELRAAINELRTHLGSRGKEGDTEYRRLADAINKLQGAHDIAYGKAVASGTPLTNLERDRVSAVDKSTRALENETKARRDNNKELTATQYAMINFAQSLTSGDVKSIAGAGAGAIGAWAGPGAGSFASIGLGLASTMYDKAMQEMAARNERITAGAGILSPSLAQTRQVSAELAAMGEAQRTKADLAIAAESRLDQIKAAASKMGIGAHEDPSSWLGGAKAFDTWGIGRGVYAWHRLPTWLGGKAETVGEARAAELDIHTQHYEQEIRRRGGELPAHLKGGKDAMLRDIVIPGLQGGVLGGGKTSGALEYQAEVQSGSLNRLEATNEKLQKIIDLMEKQGEAIHGVQVNTGEMSSFSPF